MESEFVGVSVEILIILVAAKLVRELFAGCDHPHDVRHASTP